MTEVVCPRRATYVANLTMEQYKPIAAVSRRHRADPKGTYRHVIEWALRHAEAPDGVPFTYRFTPGKDFGRMTTGGLHARGCPAGTLGTRKD